MEQLYTFTVIEECLDYFFQLAAEPAVLEMGGCGIGNVMDTVGAYLFNYPLLSLVITTTVAMLLILKPQYTVLDNLRRQRASVMNSTSQIEQISAKKAEEMLIRKVAVWSLVALFAASMSGGIISDGWS